MNPRLLLVTPYYLAHGGGVEKVASRLAEGLSASGWRVVWLASREGQSNAVPDVWGVGDLVGGVRICPVAAWNALERRTGVPFPLWGADALRKLWREIKKADVVMIHEALYVPSMLAALLARWQARPVLLVQHVGAVPYRRVWLRAVVGLGNLLWARMVHRLAQRVVYISQSVMLYFEGERLGATVKLVPNGVDLAFFTTGHLQTSRAGNIAGARLLFVGRFVEKKGLDIVSALARRRPDLRFALAGEGPMQPQPWPLPNLELLGYLSPSELVKQYQMSDALLLPSHGEGFPLVVQEAMACGLLPLVSTEIAHALPGIVDHVGHAPVARNTPNLIGLWSELIDHSLAREAGGERSRARAAFAREQWGWDRCVSTYNTLLHDLLVQQKIA